MNTFRALLSTPSRRLLAAVVAVAVAAGAAVVVHHRVTALPGDAVLRFGDEIVTETEFDEHLDALRALYGVVRPEDKDAEEDFQRDVAKSLAVSLILDRAAEEMNIVISEKSARDTLSSMIEKQLGADPRGAFQDLLTKFGVNEEDILDEVRRQQAIGRLFQEVTEDDVASVTPEDAKKLYDKDPTTFAVPEKRRIANIVVRTRKDAKQILTLLEKGRSFSALAHARSLDDATRDKGGLLGTVTAGELEKTFADAAFAAPKGGHFGPIQTAYGWNVGVVQRIVPLKQQPYEAVREQALDAVRSERAMTTWRSWLTDQIKDADVEYADAYRPAHPDEPPQDTLAGGPTP